MVFTAPFWAWLADTKGIRPAAQLSSALFFVAMLLNLILLLPGFPRHLSWLPAMASEILNGAVSPVQNFAPPLISSTWFPAHERTTATALMYEANIAGWMLCFVIPPALVPEHAATCTDPDGGTTCNAHNANSATCTAQTDAAGAACVFTTSEAVQRKGLVALWVGIAVAGALFFAAVTLYFPNAPPTPPAHSAATEKIDYASGLRRLSCDSRFWIIVACFAVPNGFQQAWSSALDIMIAPYGFDQDVAASLGLWSVGAGAAAGVLLGVFADRFRRRYKLLIMVMFVAAAAGFLVFCLICQGIVPRTSAALYGSVIVGVAAMSATNPLFLELAVETLFPVGEGLASMSMIMVLNLVNVVYLAVPVDEVGTKWQGPAVVVATLLATALMLACFREQYRRSDADEGRR